MPTVPRYSNSGGAVSRTPIQAPRQNPNAPAGAFGVATPNPLEGAIPSLINVVQEHKNRADQVALVAANNDLAALESKLLYDAKSGALNKQGKDAFALPETVNEEWRKGVSEIEAKLSNTEQRMAFSRARGEREVSVHEAVQKHVAGELKAYDDQETQSFLTNERNATLANYDDATRVETGIDRQTAALSDYAKRHGMSPEKLSDLKADATSKTYAGVIDRMLTQDQDLKASAYYKQVKEYVTGEDQDKIEKALEEGSLRGASQRGADGIVEKHADQETAIAAAKDIKDPKLRDAVEIRVRQHFQEQQQIERDNQEKLYLKATNLIDAAPGQPARQTVPAPLWSRLNLSMRNALENRSEGGTNDDQKWLNFLEKSPQEVGALNKAQFESQYWAHFDKEHRTRAEVLWNASRDALANKDAQPNLHLANTINFKDRLLNTVGKAGIVGIRPNVSPTKFTRSQAKSYAEMEQRAAKDVELFERTQLGSKREATGEEMQKIIDGVVMNHVFIDVPRGSDVEKAGWDLTSDEVGRAYVPIDHIPEIEQASLRNALKARGVGINTRKMERLFAAVVMKNRTLYESILGEK